jgi:hypothetical protein
MAAVPTPALSSGSGRVTSLGPSRQSRIIPGTGKNSYGTYAWLDRSEFSSAGGKYSMKKREKKNGKNATTVKMNEKRKERRQNMWRNRESMGTG